MRGITTKTPERVAEARRLREQGFLLREIAERLDVSAKTVDTWLQDPTGAKLRARKDSYAQPCVRSRRALTRRFGRGRRSS